METEYREQHSGPEELALVPVPTSHFPSSLLSLPYLFGIIVRLPALLTLMAIDVSGDMSDNGGQSVTLVLCGSLVHSKHLVHTSCMQGTVFYFNSFLQQSHEGYYSYPNFTQEKTGALWN